MTDMFPQEIDEPDADWSFHGDDGTYALWQSTTEDKSFWQITKIDSTGQFPRPKSNSGYYDLHSLLKLKNLSIDNFQCQNFSCNF